MAQHTAEDNRLVANPYLTYAGKLMLPDGVIKKYTDFAYTINLDDMNYGFILPCNYNAIFITGKTEQEKALPSLELPLRVDTRDGRKCIVLDIRSYLSELKDFPSYAAYDDLLDLMNKRSKDLYIGLLYMAKIMAHVFDRDMSVIQPFYKTLFRTHVVMHSRMFNKILPIPTDVNLDFDIILSL